jgi:hypothetical protein
MITTIIVECLKCAEEIVWTETTPLVIASILPPGKPVSLRI